MCLTKKLFSWVIVVTLSLLHFPTWVFANNETSFIVTAYYSPVKGQAKYLHGSYEREIYVNGKGTHGASGEAVFEGMLAAPKKYPFGTKIYFEGFWVAEVQDRWGAIVSAGSRGNNYDRIDIWMGYGDEWRERAIHWGKRTIIWEIVSSDSENTISFAKGPINWENTLETVWKDGSITEKKLSNEQQILLEYGEMQINPDSSEVLVKKLQQLMSDLWEYNGNIDGKYVSIEQDLIQLQKKVWVVQYDDDWGAGYYGNKTRSALWEHYEDKTLAIIAVSIVDTQKEAQEYTLSSGEKQKIQSALSRIQERIQKRERFGWPKLSLYMKALDAQIDTAIGQVDDPILAAKLRFIQTEIR